MLRCLFSMIVALLLLWISPVASAQPVPTLTWSTFLNGSSIDIAYQVARRDDGTIIVVGVTSSGNFPSLPGTVTPGGAGNDDVFVACLDPTLSGSAQLLWTTFLGGNGRDVAYDVAVDSNGKVLVVGYTESTNFSARGIPLSLAGPGDAFVCSLSAGGQLELSLLLGGTGRDVASSCVVTDNDRFWIGGTTESANFPTTAGAMQGTSGGGATDAFLVHVDPQQGAQAVQWASYLGGSGEEGLFPASVGGQTFELDRVTVAVPTGAGAAGLVGICGSTRSTNFPVTADAFQGQLAASRDCFAALIDPAVMGAGALVWSTYVGGALEEQAFGLAIPGPDRVVLAGTTESSNFPTAAPAVQTVFGGGAFDGFCIDFAIDPGVATTMTSGTFLGGSGNDSIVGMEWLPATGEVALVGNSTAAFPTSSDAWMANHPGNNGFAGHLTLLDLAAPGQLGFSTFVTGPGGGVLWEVGAGGGELLLAGWTNDASYPLVNPFGTQLNFLAATVGTVSLASAPMAPEFRRGDVNGDGGLDLGDPVRTLSILFAGGVSLCQDAEDANDDGSVNVADAVYLLSALFVPGSPLPPAPGTSCGVDPTPDALGCLQTGPC